MTHALQGECKTYRGCQSSGVTDSDSERQHEINMAVQTVQGRGHTDCQEGGTETRMHRHTFARLPAEDSISVCCWSGLHTHNHSLIFACIQNLLVRRGA